MFKSTIIPSVIAAAICTAGLFAAPTAFAKDVTVHYADLDLSTPNGQKQLEKRLMRAARDACDYNRLPTGSRIRGAEADTCIGQAIAASRQHVAAAVEAARNGELGG